MMYALAISTRTARAHTTTASAAAAARAALVVLALACALFATGTSAACFGRCRSMSLSVASSCVTGVNSVRCFGRNDHGQLGDSATRVGSAAASLAGPVPHTPLDFGEDSDQVLYVSVSRRHGCALMTNGSVRCWGAPVAGELGYDLPLGQTTITARDAQTVQVTRTGELAMDVFTAEGLTCILLETGRLHCFGDNTHGRLGNVNQAATHSPPFEHPESRIAVPNNERVVSMCASQSHLCIVTEEGNVACLGSDANGALGYKGVTVSYSMLEHGFVNITANPNPMTPVKAIACGLVHTCAITRRGQIKCWGANNEGQLGTAFDDKVGLSEEPAYYSAQSGYAREYVLLDQSETVEASDIAAGEAHTCIISYGGQVYCWGEGDNGRLGYGSTLSVGGVERSQPYDVGAVAFPSDAGGIAVEIAAGARHTCVRFHLYDIFCFGDGEYGALGIGVANVNVGATQTPKSLDLKALLEIDQTGPRGDCKECTYWEDDSWPVEPSLSPSATPLETEDDDRGVVNTGGGGDGGDSGNSNSIRTSTTPLPANSPIPREGDNITGVILIVFFALLLLLCASVCVLFILWRRSTARRLSAAAGGGGSSSKANSRRPTIKSAHGDSHRGARSAQRSRRGTSTATTTGGGGGGGGGGGVSRSRSASHSPAAAAAAAAAAGRGGGNVYASPAQFLHGSGGSAKTTSKMANSSDMSLSLRTESNAANVYDVVGVAGGGGGKGSSTLRGGGGNHGNQGYQQMMTLGLDSVGVIRYATPHGAAGARAATMNAQSKSSSHSAGVYADLPRDDNAVDEVAYTQIDKAMDEKTKQQPNKNSAALHYDQSILSANAAPAEYSQLELRRGGGDGGGGGGGRVRAARGETEYDVINVHKSGVKKGTPMPRANAAKQMAPTAATNKQYEQASSPVSDFSGAGGDDYVQLRLKSARAANASDYEHADAALK